MAQVINTNVSSLNAQRNLNTSQSALNTSLQRLSSGIRINSAKDDAAGLSISERMSSQIRGLDQAQRNANDAVSLMQTAEGALASSGDILQRMRELAVQSSNATNTASDRQSIQNEIGQLGSELDRISQATQFNGKNLFDGTFGTVKFQIGANANQVVDASASNLRITAYGNYQIGAGATGSTGLGAGAVLPTGTELAPLASGSFDINGSVGSSTITVASSDSATTIANKVNNVTVSTGVTATARNDVQLKFGTAGVYNLNIGGDNTAYSTDYTPYASSLEAVTFTLSATDSTDGLSAAITAFNDKSAKTGLVASLNATNDGIILSSAAGANVVVEDTTATNAGSVSVQGLQSDPTAATWPALTTLGSAQTLASDATAEGTVVVGQITLDSEKSFSAVQAAGGLNIFAAAGAATISTTLNDVATLDVTTFLNSTQAIKTIDSALAYVNSERAKFGALQNRLTSTMANLAATSENLSASRSRIRDADFAVETASLTRGQILQQAGVAMLSQANSQPNSVLSLLK